MTNLPHTRSPDYDSFPLELEAIYASAPIGLCVLDTQLRFVRINQILADMNGFSIDAHIGRTVREVLPELADFFEPQLMEVIQTGQARLNVEVTGETPAQPGVTRFWKEHWWPIRNESGEVFGVNIVTEEVTETRRAEAILRENEGRFRTMADTAPTMLWITDENGQCVFLSRGWYEFTGQTEIEGLGIGWTNAIHPDDRVQAGQIFRRSAENRQPFSIDYRLRHRDGEYRWAIDAGRPRFDEHGNWLGYIGSVIDMHERKQAEEALRESESRFRLLFSSIDEGYCLCEMILDAKGHAVDYRFLEANPLFEKMTGLVDAVGRTALELVPGLESHWVETYARVALNGEILRFENGSEPMGRWFDVFATPVKPHGRFALVFRDITERRRNEQERAALLESEQAARHEAEKANETKMRFLGMISHELRTPLASIKGFASSLLADDVTWDAGTQRSFIEVIDEEADRLQLMIDDLLNLSHLKAGKFRIDPGRYQVTDIVEEATSHLRALTPEHRLSIDIPASLPPVWADKLRMIQVLSNLVNNAAKYSPSQTAISVSAEQKDPYIEFCVADEGQGIPPDMREMVFEPFQQLEGGKKGVGLGLAICKGIVEAHGGTVWVKDKAAPGSLICFTIPLANNMADRAN